jgi:hypothetical protein
MTPKVNTLKKGTFSAHMFIKTLYVITFGQTISDHNLITLGNRIPISIEQAQLTRLAQAT